MPELGYRQILSPKQADRGFAAQGFIHVEVMFFIM